MDTFTKSCLDKTCICGTCSHLRFRPQQICHGAPYCAIDFRRRRKYRCNYYVNENIRFKNSQALD